MDEPIGLGLPTWEVLGHSFLSTNQVLEILFPIIGLLTASYFLCILDLT